MNTMQEKIMTQENVNLVRALQDQLKKECLLLEREAKEKAKIMHEIEDNIQNYYAVIVDKKGMGRVLKDFGLGNCENFVKDIILALSHDLNLALGMLMLLDYQDAGMLTEMLLTLFLNSFTESDPYHQKTTEFGLKLGERICHHLLAEQKIFHSNHEQFSFSLSEVSPHLVIVLKKYLEQQINKQYFQMLANKIFNAIPPSFRDVNEFTRRESFCHISDDQSFIQIKNPMSSMGFSRGKSFMINREEQIQKRIETIVNEYISQVINKADLMPLSIRILIHCFKKQLKVVHPQALNFFISQILVPEYLRPFMKKEKPKWSHFKNSFFQETVDRICKQIALRMDSMLFSKIIEKTHIISQAKLIFSTENKERIQINGGCVSYKQLSIILEVMKKQNEKIRKMNERAANRCLKVHQITKDFQLFKSYPQWDKSFIVFTQIIYGNIVQKNYQSIYINCYKDSKLKDILKQILSDSGFHISHNFHNLSLKNHLEDLVREQEQNKSISLNYSSQFMMKIKYFLHLMKKEDINESQLFKNMIGECLQRQEMNVGLFRSNKMLLLQAVTSILTASKSAIKKKEKEKKIESHLRVVHILDSIELSLCVSAPSTRPKKNQYTSSEPGRVTLTNSSECFHQDNIEEGLKYHAKTVKDAIYILGSLKQMKAALSSTEDKCRIYDAFCDLIEILKEQCRKNFLINTEEYQYFENSIYKIILRELYEMLITHGQIFSKDLEFQSKLKVLSFIKPNKIKIKEIKNFSQFEQVWEIVCRYLINMKERKTPSNKINAIKEILEIIRIALQKDFKAISQDKISIEVLFAYCLIRAKPSKFISSLNFIEIFLSKDRLLSREGGMLKSVRNSVRLIVEGRMKEFVDMGGEEYSEKEAKEEIEGKTEKFKEKQLKSSIFI